MSTATMTLDDASAFIDQASPDELDALTRMLTIRKSYVERQRTAAIIPGTKVALTAENISPKYLGELAPLGVHFTVTDVKNGRSGLALTGEVRFPLSPLLNDRDRITRQNLAHTDYAIARLLNKATKYLSPRIDGNEAVYRISGAATLFSVVG